MSVDEKQDLAVSISSSGAASVSVSVEVNGIVYSGIAYKTNPRMHCVEQGFPNEGHMFTEL